jgi:hypothetical protein
MTALKSNLKVLLALIGLALSSCSSAGVKVEKPVYMAVQDEYMDTNYTANGVSGGLAYYTATIDGVNQAVVDRDRTTFTGTTVTIPSSYTINSVTYTVVGIKESAFYDAGITSVGTLPTSLTMIGSQAFGNGTFTSINIPAGVTTLNPETFIHCPSLKSITFTDATKVTSIADHCFDGDYQLTGLSFSAFTSLSSIGASSFSYCQSLKNVILPSSLTSIGSYAFDDCNNISTFYLPNSVTSLGEYCLKGVSNGNIKALSNFSSDPATGASDATNYKTTWRNKTITATDKISFNWGTLYASGTTNDGFYYTVSDGKATIIGYDGSSVSQTAQSIHLVIPASLGGYPVTYIDSYVFNSHKELHCVTFPSTVVEIRSHAFYSCNMAEINFPADADLTKIADYAFYCDSNSTLTSITIPKKVQTIGDLAFRGYNKLATITFTGASDNTAALKTIGQKAFMPQDQNNSVAYADATNDLVFPNTLTSIGNSAFAWCHYLKSITFMPNDLTSVTLSIDTWAFSRVYNVQTITFSKNLVSIGETAFEHLTEAGNQNRPTLHSVYMPSSVTTIGAGAFAACNGIKFYCQIKEADKPSGWNANWNSYTEKGGTINPDGQKMSVLPTYWNVGTESGQRKLVSGDGSAGSFDYIQNVDSSGTPIDSYTCSCFYFQGTNTTAEKNVTVPSSITVNSTSYPVTAIGNSAFYRSVNTATSGYGLNTISLPSSVTSIGDYAFANCTELSSTLDLSSSGLQTLGVDAFGWDTSITTLVLPHSVTSLGSTGTSFSFYGCTKISSLTIVDATPTIDRNGLWTDNTSPAESSPNIVYSNKTAVYCAPAYSIGALTLAEGAETVADSCFYGRSGLTSVALSSTMQTLNINAFANCSNLTTVTGGTGLTTLGLYAFYGDSKLNSVSFSSMTNLNSMGSGAFTSTAITSCDLSATQLTTIASSCFSSCGSLTSVTLPSTTGLTVGESAFSSDSKLETINWGSTVTSIGKTAFSGCSALTSLSVPSTVTSLGESSFASCTKLASVNLSSGVASIPASTFSGDSALASVSFDASYTQETNPTTTSYSIGAAAFKGCSFSSIILPYGASFPSGLSSGSYIFEGNSNLTAIYLRATGAYYQANPANYPVGWNYKANSSQYQVYYYATNQGDVDTSHGDNFTYWHYSNGAPTLWANIKAMPEA